MSEDTLLLAIAELKKQNIELADRVSRLEHARAEDAQRIDAHGMLIERASRRTPLREQQ